VRNKDRGLVFPDARGGPTKLHALTGSFLRGLLGGDVSFTRCAIAAQPGCWDKAGTFVVFRLSFATACHPSTTLNIDGHAAAELKVRAVAAIDATLDAGLARQKRGTKRVLGYQMATIKPA